MTAEAGVPEAALEAECQRLLEFGRHFPHPLGGAAWLDVAGQPDMSRPVYWAAPAISTWQRRRSLG